jgi:hypothetical protein
MHMRLSIDPVLNPRTPANKTNSCADRFKRGNICNIKWGIQKKISAHASRVLEKHRENNMLAIALPAALFASFLFLFLGQ